MSYRVSLPVHSASPNRSSHLDAEAIDERLRLLASSHRRYVLELLIGSDESNASVDAVVEYVSNRSGEPIDRVRLQLCHKHLPRLESTGVVERASDPDTISYTGDRLLEDILRQVRVRETAPL